MSYKYFFNNKCELFPCHKGTNKNEYNCLFCYCPLYHLKDCEGNYIILDNGIKDCTNCVIPHTNYDYIINKLIGGK